ncbi:recombination regulator RecX [Streptomyces sp. CWNU-52B]|uniref:recombination regulator RecX n=1 Tax=unclassified Streptomyces TaxID=2593676 RepID=UPI0039C02D28
MTRRTDWAEYVYPVASPGQGHGGDIDTASDTDTDSAYDEQGGGRRPVGGSRRSGGRTRGDGQREGGGAPGGVSGRGSGDWPYRGGGEDHTEPGGGTQDESDPSRTGRARRARGRRRGFGESSGGAQDGDIPASSRAEKGESPGDPAERARAICLRLLTGNPRTRKQLADALRKREIPDDVADEVLSRFEEVGLIDDGAFADAWVESRHRGRGLARRALAQELRTKGVDPTLIDEAVGQLDSDQEETTARALVARKLSATRGLDRDKRIRRLAGMLARKGYSQGTALRVVRQALEEEGEDTEFLGDEGF